MFTLNRLTPIALLFLITCLFPAPQLRAQIVTLADLGGSTDVSLIPVRPPDPAPVPASSAAAAAAAAAPADIYVSTASGFPKPISEYAIDEGLLERQLQALTPERLELLDLWSYQHHSERTYLLEHLSQQEYERAVRDYPSLNFQSPPNQEELTLLKRMITEAKKSGVPNIHLAQSEFIQL